MTAIIIIGVIIVVIVFAFSQSGNSKPSAINQYYQEVTAKIDALVAADEISQEQADKFKEAIPVQHLDYHLDLLKTEHRRIKRLKEKYDSDTYDKIINQKYWLGMTAEHVIDSKGGEPTTIEKQMAKDKLKETYYYGPKSKGDYFVLENGVVTKIVDR